MTRNSEWSLAHVAFLSRRASSIVAATVALLGCVTHVSPAQRGAELVADPALSSSTYNVFACTTCHRRPTDASDDRVLPGAPLAGAARRPTFWGGTIVDLREAVQVCFQRFMRGGPLDANDERGQAVYAYLESIADVPAAITTAVAFTIPSRVAEPSLGDAMRGAGVWRRACQSCHGELHTGAGRLGGSTTIAIVPDDTEREHRPPEYDLAALRTIVVQKTRHGSFLGFAGTMPPFALEVLSEADVNDLVAYVNPQPRP